jgi:hypothetical protein
VSVNGRLIHGEVFEEAVRLLSAAQEANVRIRALGGMAVVLHVGELLHPAFRREIRDIDLAAAKGDGRRVATFLADQGYTPNRTFNAMHGAHRLLFYDEPNGRQIDVFVGRFEMCHALPLTDRLELEPLTLPLAELVMTKLQIVKLNRKDMLDLYALLLTHDVAQHDDDTINSTRIAELCSADWGLYRTFQLNLERLEEEADLPELTQAEQATIRARVHDLWNAIERAPKSAKWKMRARVGDRVRWYEDPDEVEPGGY